MPPRARLSVVVITKNEEPRIGRCLESVRWADELLVVDGESADRTVEICRRFGAHVIEPPFGGSCAQERNLRHDGWYHYLPNLVRRDAVRYEGLVHERPIVQGTMGQLDADVEHQACEDLSEFLKRHNRYTSLAAQEMIKGGERLTEREISTRMLRRPWKTFWKSYVKKQGFREGMHGLGFAIFFASVKFLKWAKYWEAVHVFKEVES